MTQQPTDEKLDKKVEQSGRPLVEQEAPLETGDRYQLLLDSITDGCWVLDKEWRYTMVNEAGSQFVDKSPDELVGQKITSLFPEVEKTEFFAAYERSMKKRTTEKVSAPFVFPDGRKGFYEVRVYPVAEGILCIGADITERKRVEEALRESENRYRSIFENILDVYYRADLEGNLIEVSPSGVKLLGYDSSEEMIGKNIAKEFYADPQEREHLKSEIMKYGKIRFQGTLKRKDGTLVVIETNSRLIYDETGKPVAIEGIFRDITDEKRAADLVRTNERLQREIDRRKQAEETLRIKDRAIASSINGIAFAEFGGNLTYVNESFLKMWGYSDYHEVSGRPAIEFWDVKEEALTVVDHLQHSGSWIGELVAKRKDGSLFDVQISASIVSNEAGEPIHMMASFVDITEGKRAAEALRASERRFRQLTENIREVFWMTDPDKNEMLYVSPAYQEIWGRTCQSLYEKPRSFLDAVHPEDREGVISSFNAQRRGDSIDVEYRIIQPNGSVRVIWSRGFPVRNEHGGFCCIAGIAEDVTERKQMENALRKSNEALRAQADKLEETNTALNVLLERRGKDRQELEEKVVSNVKELILPYIESLKKTPLNTKQMTCVNIVESNLREIVSPFLRKLASEYFGLTPKEIRIAGLVKRGKTTKEISEFLGVSTRAVQFHRNNIRAKLGLKNQRVNLETYLLSLS